MKRYLWLLLILPAAARAQVTTTTLSVTYTCTGGVGPFAFNFPISSAAAMTVTQNGTVLASSAYTVVPVNNNYSNGGSVTLIAGCPASQPLVLKRITPITQTTIFANNMPAPMSATGNSVDKLTEIAQELAAVGSGGGSIPYPSAGVPNSTGAAWGATYNAANNIPYNFLPPATSSTPGTIQPDNTSCVVSAGILSCPGSSPDGTATAIQTQSSPAGTFKGSAATLTPAGAGVFPASVTTPNVNMLLNTDQFISGGGNNGIGNAQASSNCVAGCNLMQPFGSTSTENPFTAITVSNTSYASYVNGTYSSFLFNPGLNNSASFRPGYQTICFWDDIWAVASGGAMYAPCHQDIMTFSSPTRYGAGGQIAQMYAPSAYFYSLANTQMWNPVIQSNHLGDSIMGEVYFSTRGGAIASADEENKLWGETIKEGSPPAGTITLGGANATIVGANYNINNTNMGPAGNLISESEVVDSGTITSQGTQGGLLLNYLTVSPTTHPAVSTAYGTLASPCGAIATIAAPSTQTCTVTLISGTFSSTLFSNNATVCIGDYAAPEQDLVISVGTAGATQTITIAMYNGAIGTAQHPTGTPVYQGGGCGGKFVVANGSTTPLAESNGSTITGDYTTYFIAGSRSTSTYDFINILLGGQNGQQPMPAITGVPPNVNIAGLTGVSLSSLSASGGTVTATAVTYAPEFLNGWTAPSNACVQIAGSSNATLNGCATNITFNGDTFTLTYFLTGATGTAASASLSLVGMNNYEIVCGAMIGNVLGATPQNPQGTGKPWGDGRVQVEANNCSWPVGQRVAQPNFYNQTIAISNELSMANTQANLTTPFGRQTGLTGLGNSGAPHYQEITGDPITSFQGYGGTFVGHQGMWGRDYYSKFLHMTWAPIQGGCAICWDFDPPSTANGGSSINPSTGFHYLVNSPHLQIQIQPANSKISVSGFPWYFATDSLFQNGNNVLDTASLVAGSGITLTPSGTNTVTIASSGGGGISNPITSATPASGITSATCISATCTNLRGSYTIVGGTFSGGTFLTLVWPTTTTAYVCTVIQNDTSGETTSFLSIGHSVATATGMTISSGITLVSQTINVDYICQP